MTTTETQPRVKKPAAEIIGNFEDVLRRGKCEDGRDLYAFETLIEIFDRETFILSGTPLQASQAMLQSLGTISKIQQGTISDRCRKEYLKCKEEERNGDTEDGTEAPA